MKLKSCYSCDNLKAKKEGDDFKVRCTKRELKLPIKNYSSLQEIKSLNTIIFFTEAKDCEFYTF